ncbi:MAG: 5-oxoprolinase subunit PxpB [Acidobacteriota bacterium]|nr:MAG: 5-oxoprolinase subunit PxpB [Acidobacteriota bacterium]
MKAEPLDFEILPLGEDCAVISLGNVISEDVNRRAVSIAEAVNSFGFEALIEAAPAYSSVAVYYDPRKARSGVMTPFQIVRTLLKQIVPAAVTSATAEERVHTVPATFGGEHGPDLKEVADRRGLSADEVVEIFLSRNYRVFMLGFLPGFPYLGTLDQRIATSRRSTPRTLVPAGSIGIAGSQTGIYPFDSPGGWQLIGRTDVIVFDPGSEEPAMFRPGDSVRFTEAP